MQINSSTERFAGTTNAQNTLQHFGHCGRPLRIPAQTCQLNATFTYVRMFINE